MSSIAAFLTVLSRAQRDLEPLRAEKRSDYWDTVSAVIIDKHFIAMAAKEMRSPGRTWQEGLKMMQDACDRKLRAVDLGDLAASIIEIKGACAFLLDRYGDETGA